MTRRSRTPSGLLLLAVCAAGCGTQPPPATGPTPADIATAETPPPEPAAELPAPEVVEFREGEDRLPDDVPSGLALEGIEPDPEEPAGPTPEDVDRELRALLGTDPIGMTQLPTVPRAPEMPIEMNDRVEAWINYFQSVIPERFGLYLERKGRYESMIRQKLRRAGMPEELIYLALIESGMNPNAYSRAAAVGMWQFIRGTARMYDLEVSFWLDERRDPEKATDAALAYLSDLYGEFGSWYLAAAAYNGGPGRVRRGMRRVPGGTFWDLADRRLLRSETRNYVPKLIAAAVIGRDPERFGFGDVKPAEPLEFDIVDIPDATSFDVIAEAAGTDQETIRALNPHFPRRVTPPGRPVSIKVPAGAGTAFATNYAAIPPDERVSWIVHTVTRGQTLSHIASRYGTSVAALRAANNNVNPRRLRIGQRLVVPSPARVASRSSSTPTAAAGEPTGTERPGPVTVVVRRGDTLWAIARRYRVSTEQLMAWNNLTSTVIKPGDRIQIQR